jgi:hypothetical protein
MKLILVLNWAYYVLGIEAITTSELRDVFFCQLLINNSMLHYNTHNGASGIVNYNDISF